MNWKSIKTMPFQKVCLVKNPMMENPVLATRGYATENGVHPDNTFCTTVFTPHKFFSTPAGNLVCPDSWAPFDEEYSGPEPDINGDTKPPHPIRKRGRETMQL